MTEKTIVFTGGGTAGHVFPALAVIEQLRLIGGYKFVWIGSRGGMEEDIINKTGIPYYGISSGKLRRYLSFSNLIDLFKITAGFFQARRYLGKIKPDLLFSKGGFVSVPPVVAAKTRRIPTITHESDIDPGLATKINCRFVDRIFTGYEQTLNYFSPKHQSKCTVSGNPVRQMFFEGNAQRGLEFLNISTKSKKPVLLVLGGSSGAKQVNQLIEEALPELLKNFIVVHQMGGNLYKESKTEGYYTTPFFNEEISDILSAADIAVSRAGAGSLWELVATETPSVLIPLTVGSRGDQVRNAAVFKDKGVANVLVDQDANPKKLIASLLSMLPGSDTFKVMHKQIKKMSEKNSAEFIAKEIIQMTNKTENKENK